MKTTLNLLSWIFVLLFAFSLASRKDDDEEEQDNVEIVGVSPADAVAGTYSGRRTYGTEVISDAYIVTITKITNSTVSLKADFFESVDNPDGIVNFNVSEQGNQYVLENATEANISIVVSGNSISINYLTNGNYMMSYYGTKS